VACNHSGTGHRPALPVVWASRARAPCLTAEALPGGRDGCGRLTARARGGGGGPAKGSPCHHVGWHYCLVPSLDRPAQRQLLPWRRHRRRTASFPAARPAPRAGARTWSPRPEGRGSRVAPPWRTRPPRRKTLARAAGGTACLAGTGLARLTSFQGRSAVYFGTAAGAAAARPHAPGNRAPAAPGRVPRSRLPARGPPASRGRGCGLDPRRAARVCRRARHPRRPGLRRKRACRRERGNARAGAHRPRPAGRHAGP
jgi:hypothetical protein